MNIHVLFAFWLLSGGFSASAQQVSPSTECPEYDRVAYSAPRKDWPGAIEINDVQGQPASNSITGLERHRSPQGTTSYVVREPDTTRPGPWTTVIEVFGNKARPIHLIVRFPDHLSGGVRISWLNEKLLWLQMWRGRIVSTDMILDIDAGRFIYQQDANYNGLIVPCSMKIGFPE